VDELILSKVNSDVRKGFPIGVEEQEVAWLTLLYGNVGEGARHLAGTAGESDAVAPIDVMHETAAIKSLLRGVSSAPVRDPSKA
jgi:hypothetical protein